MKQSDRLFITKNLWNKIIALLQNDGR